MIASLIAATVLSSELDWLDHKVAFRTPGVPFSMLVKDLSIQTGRTVTVAPELEREVLAIRVDDVETGDLLALMAEVSYGKLTVSSVTARFDLDEERIEREKSEKLAAKRDTLQRALKAADYLAKPHLYTIKGELVRYSPLPAFVLLPIVFAQFTPEQVEAALRGETIFRSTGGSSPEASLKLEESQYQMMVLEAKRLDALQAEFDREAGVVGILRPPLASPLRLVAELGSGYSGDHVFLKLSLVDANDREHEAYEYHLEDWSLFDSFGLEHFPFPKEIRPAYPDFNEPRPSDTPWRADKEIVQISPRGNAIRAWFDEEYVSEELEELARETIRDPVLYEPTSVPWGEYVVGAASLAGKDLVAVLPEDRTGLESHTLDKPDVRSIRWSLNRVRQDMPSRLSLASAPGDWWLLHRDLPERAQADQRASRQATKTFIEKIAGQNWISLDERARLAEPLGNGPYANAVRGLLPSVRASFFGVLESQAWLSVWGRLSDEEKDAVKSGKSISYAALSGDVQAQLRTIAQQAEWNKPLYYFSDTLVTRQRRKLHESGRGSEMAGSFPPRWSLKMQVFQSSLHLRVFELPAVIAFGDSEKVALAAEDLGMAKFLGVQQDETLEEALKSSGGSSGIIRVYVLSLQSQGKVVALGYLHEVAEDASPKHKDESWLKALIAEADKEARRLESDPVAKLAKEFPFLLSNFSDTHSAQPPTFSLGIR